MLLVVLKIRLLSNSSGFDYGFAMTMNSSNEFVFPNEKHKGTRHIKVLGVKWKPIEDKFIFSLQDVVETALNYQGSITKRHMVKITASHYDPPVFCLRF